MVVSFRHKGLEAFFRSGTQAGIQPIHAKRLWEMPAARQAAGRIGELAAGLRV
jgi:proteic killer suppression protein